MKYSKLTTQRGDSLTLNMDLPSNFSYDNDRYNIVVETDNSGLVRWETKKIKDLFRRKQLQDSELKIKETKL